MLGREVTMSRRILVVAAVLVSCFALTTTSAQAQLWSGILAPTRAANWTQSGVAGGIPSRTTICSTLNPGATASQINSAIANCGSGQVVYLNAGTYNLSAGIVFNGKSNVTLRGAGSNQTFLVFSNGGGCHGYEADICIDSSDTNWSGGPSNTANWTAGYAAGTTSITLSSVANLTVGAPLILDQKDDPSDNGGVYVCADSTSGAPCSLEGNTNNGQRLQRNQVQIVTVVSCGTASTAGQTCNGTNVTISPGLYMSNWTSAKSPGAWWASNPVRNNGIESLSMDHTNSAGNRGVEIFNCSGCWVKAVRDIDSGKAHVEVSESTRTTVRDSYFYLTQNSVSQSYGVASFNTSDMLVENNIFQYVASPEMINGSCSGCVIGYNYSINDYFTTSAGYVSASTNDHTAGIDMLLYEGNVGAALYADNFHGTHNLVTAFRNYWSGTQPACYNGTAFRFSACNSNQMALDIRSYSRYFNIVGNVLGQAGVQNAYEDYPGGAASGTALIELGWGNTEGSVTVPNDTLVRSTLMRWGNWDTVNQAARFVASEVPSGLSSYANPVPSSQSLPASFYLNAKPSWWPSAKAWPPIGPDVTGGNIANLGGHVYTIPAQDCYTNTMKGPADGTGSVLAFDSAVCYSGGSPAPAAPTGLTATVH